MKRFVYSVLVAVVACGSAAALLAASAPGAKVGQPAPDFALKDQNGKSVSLADFKGKIVVLEWTNPGCPFVQRHYRQHTMENLARQYKDKDVVWLAINSTEGSDQKVNKHWAQENHLTYPVLDDSHGKVAKEYRAKSTPDLFIVDKNGKLVYTGGIDNDPSGEKPDRINYVKKALDEILVGNPVSIPVTKSYGCGVHYED